MVIPMAKQAEGPLDPASDFRAEILKRGDLLLNLPFEGLYVLDADGYLVDMSDTFCRNLGYSREEMKGMHVSGWDIRWSLPNNQQHEHLLAPSEAISEPFESMHRTKSGHLIPVEVRTVLIRMEKEVFLYCSSRDRTAEIKSRHLSEVNDLMLRVNQEISTVEDEKILLSRICELAVDFGHLGLAWVGCPDESGRFLFLAASGATSYLDGILISSSSEIPEGQGPAGTVFREDRAIFSESFDSYKGLSPWRQRALHFNFHATASLPIHRGGKVWGVLVVYHRETDFFNQEMRSLLEELARDISRGLDRLDIRSRERELSAIQEALLDNTVVGITMVEGRKLLSVNTRLLNLLGYEYPEELMEQSTRILYPDEEEYSRIGHVYRLIEEKGTINITDVRLQKKDGSILMCDVSASLVSLLPEKKSVWTIEDVTEKHRHSRKVQLLLGLNKMLAQVNMAVATAQEESFLMQKICDLVIQYGDMELAWIGRPDDSGYVRFIASAGETRSLDHVVIPLGTGPPEEMEAVSRAFYNGRPIFTDSKSPSGAPWSQEAQSLGAVSIAALPIHRGGKIWGLLVMYYRGEGLFSGEDLKGVFEELALDISRGLDRLDELRQQWVLSNALASIEDGVAISDSSHRVTWVNKAFTAVTGFGETEILGQNLKILQCSGTNSQTVDEIREALSRGEVFHGQILNAKKDGSTFWNLLTINPMKSHSGEITGFVGVQRDVSDMVALREQLEFQSLHDPLTGLPNRRALDHHLAMAMARSRRNGTVVALGLMDLDDFKLVNDRFGHEAGDRLLRELVSRFSLRLRENDFLARLGGDEFVIVIEDLSEELLPGQIEPFLHRLHEVVESPFILSGGEQAFVGMSLGMAYYPLDAVEGDALVRQADMAMYKLKKDKGNRTVWWQRTDQSSHLAGHPVSEEASDPYGKAVKGLLKRYRTEIGDAIEKVIESFYERMVPESEAAVIFSSLSPDEMKSLRKLQVEHLKFALDPETTREALQDCAKEIGRIHFLTGVGNEILLRAKSFCVKVLKDNLDQSIPVLKDLTHILVAAEWRLHEDIEMQISSGVATMEQYRSILASPLPPKGTLWTDARALEIRMLGQLPGLQAVLFARPDSRGVFMIEEYGGTMGEIGSSVLRTPELESVIDPSSPRGQGLLSRAWRSLHFQTSPSFHLDPIFAPWHEVIKKLGIHSVMVLLVRDHLKNPVALIGFYGAYPNQFESSTMKQFALGVEQRWEKIWTQANS